LYRKPATDPNAVPTASSSPTNTDSDIGAESSGAEPPWGQVISGMISSATMFATLIIGLIAGPAVSL